MKKFVPIFLRYYLLRSNGAAFCPSACHVPVKPNNKVMIRQRQIVYKTVIGKKDHVISISRTTILHAAIVPINTEIIDVMKPKRPYSIKNDFKIV